MDNLKKIGPRYENLAIPRDRVDTTGKAEPFKVKRGALSYRITESLNRLAQPKKSFLPAEQINYLTLRASNLVAVENKQNQSAKRNLKLDTYAKMIANNDKQCPSRIKKLARPKRSISDDEHFGFSDSDK